MKIESFATLWPILLAVIIGGGIGATLGYFGQCSTGACPLTANPWRGALMGAFAGFLLITPNGPSKCPPSSAGQSCDVSTDKDLKP